VLLRRKTCYRKQLKNGGGVILISAVLSMTYIATAATTNEMPSVAPSKSDYQMRVEFTEKLKNLVSEKKVVAASQLWEQLKAENRFKDKVTLADNDNKKLTTPEIYHSKQKGVLVFGYVYKCNRCPKWHASTAGGFVISKDGLAVTSYSFINKDNAEAFGAFNIDGDFFQVEKVVASSQKNDLAIVKLKSVNNGAFHPLALQSTLPHVGSEVTVIYHLINSRFFSVSTGIISRYYFPFQRDVSKRDSLRIAISASLTGNDFLIHNNDRKISKNRADGSFGCPVFDDTGSVIGVVAQTKETGHNKTIFPTRSILELLPHTPPPP
jgi:serine protease Do